MKLDSKDKLNARLKNKKLECSIIVLATSNGFIFHLLNRGFKSMTATASPVLFSFPEVKLKFLTV